MGIPGSRTVLDTFLLPADLWPGLMDDDADPAEIIDIIETRRRFEELRAARDIDRADAGRTAADHVGEDDDGAA